MIDAHPAGFVYCDQRGHGRFPHRLNQVRGFFPGVLIIHAIDRTSPISLPASEPGMFVFTPVAPGGPEIQQPDFSRQVFRRKIPCRTHALEGVKNQVPFPDEGGRDFSRVQSQSDRVETPPITTKIASGSKNRFIREETRPVELPQPPFPAHDARPGGTGDR